MSNKIGRKRVLIVTEKCLDLVYLVELTITSQSKLSSLFGPRIIIFL